MYFNDVFNLFINIIYFIEINIYMKYVLIKYIFKNN